MDEFLRKVIEGDGSTPPADCLDAFKDKFSNAINVEWHAREDYYEAVFYKNKLEHVAVFTPSGVLSEYKLMLPEGYLPGKIIDQLKERGEIMNAVLRNKGNSIEYEVIIFDSNLKRIMMIFSEQGKILTSKEL
ncbi:MAG: hypothetical protein JW965_04315 [Bacteroidales bacterium]|nr:hypothetical protein [Bacteroidales bacterium]